LLNGLGGFIFFGISDKGEIMGQQVTAKTLEDITHELRRIEPPVFPEIETISIGKDRVIIAIHIPGKMGTYCYDGRLINAAIALYGKSEKLFSSYPQLALRLARFRGSDRLTGFMDNLDYWGISIFLED
jgi:predicted HTH transcriptional regulator